MHPCACVGNEPRANGQETVLGSSSGACSSSGAASFSAPPSSSGASCSIDKHAIGYKSLWEADYPWLSEGDVVGMLPHPLTRYFNFLGETLRGLRYLVCLSVQASTHF